MTEWIWVETEAAVAATSRTAGGMGRGPDGIRDEGAFESAMARPQNLAVYGEPDAPALAASYAYGLARNHPFVDGNKRTAAVVVGRLSATSMAMPSKRLMPRSR